MDAKTRIVTVFDEPVIHCGLRSTINAQADMTHCGTASNGHHGLALIEREAPHIALVDVELPGRSGIDLAAALQASHSATKVVLYPGTVPDIYVATGIAARCAGVVDRKADLDALVIAIRTVARGAPYYSASIRDRLKIDPETGEADMDPNVGFASLTPRQFEVVLHLVRGRTIKEAAHAMKLTWRTVDNHATKAMFRLGVSDRATLVRRAIEEGIINA